jgi:hypothetical protein
MTYERGAGRLAETRQHVDDPGRKADLLDQLGEAERRERRLLGRLENHGAARGERGGELPRRHRQREVPRDDRAHDADRLPARVHVHLGEGRGERFSPHLRAPPGEVAEVVDYDRKVTLPRIPKRLAVVEALQLRELLRVLLNQVREPEQQEPAIARGEP